MSDSLRDQLLKAGFSTPSSEPETKSRSRRRRGKSASRSPGPTTNTPHGKGHGAHSRSGAKPAAQTDDADTRKRKALKARIKALIEKDQIDKHAGESIFRYLLGNRIRELHVTPEIHRQLVEGVVSVTRLNGNTCLVPMSTIEAIRKINPDWAIMTAAGESDADMEGYEQYQVPDDLQW